MNTADSRTAPPDAFGPFRVLHQIGAGALGPVFRAYEPDLDKLVAVKRFNLPLPPDQVHRLSAELDVLVQADLSHPAIAAPIATGITGVTAYLAQDLVSADAINRVTGEHGRMAPAEAVRIVTQLAGALDFAATIGVYHGAFHARDVLVSSDEVRLTGLGIAQALERIGEAPPIRRPFAAPEQVSGEAWNHRADLFALAVLAHELLWGKRVTATGDAAAMALAELPGGDLDLLRVAFARGLAKDPAERFDNALLFAEELAVAFTESVTEDDEPLAFSSIPVDHPAGRPPLEADGSQDLTLRDSAASAPAVSVSPTPEELRAFVTEEPVEARHDAGPSSLGPVAREASETVPPYTLPSDGPRAHPDESADQLQPLQAAVFISPEEARSTLWPVVLAALIFAAIGFAAGQAVATLGGLSLFGGVSLEPTVQEGVPPLSATPDIPAPATQTEEPQVVGERPIVLPPEGGEPAIESPPTVSPSSPLQPQAVSETPSSMRGTGPPSLTVESRPPGAAVFVDGRQMGRTPLVTDSIAIGEHVIRLELAGYQDWTTAVGITAGSNRIAASLQP